MAALSAPIREVQAMVGPGWSDDPGTEPAPVLAGVRDALADVGAAAGRSWTQADNHWRGAAADGAAAFTASAAAAAEALARRAEHMRADADGAAAAVARASEQLRAIVDEFEARASTLEPRLDSADPADAAHAAEQLLAEARRSLSEAIAVVSELRSELDSRAAAVAGPASGASPPPPAPTTPTGFTGAPASPLPSLGSAVGPGLDSGSGFGNLGAFSTSSPSEAAVGLADPGEFGNGVAVRLPDGSTALAPNAVAASAVRHALTQLGVPYQWGGTTPGVGLDCSGLTQWAYHEAGLNIPRLAQEQDVGTGVDSGALRPGDLAVWDGHVAMVVGDGLMIEAGDPVQLSPVRTTNAGQGFQGFFRPTA